MSIAQKLQTIAENEQKVYDTAKNVYGLNGKAQGELVTINNIHPLEKTVKINLSSADITDFSGVKVKANGKNFFKAINENIRIKPNVKYRLSSAESSETRIAFWLYDADMNELKTLSKSIYGFYYGNSYGFWQSGSDASKLNFTLTFPSEVAYIKFRNRYKNMQFELGSSATEYEPYVGAEYAVNQDGTVEGVKSILPIMNISTDTAGVIIAAECFIDPQAVINEITTAVINFGGDT